MHLSLTKESQNEYKQRTLDSEILKSLPIRWGEVVPLGSGSLWKPHLFYNE